MSDFKTSHWDGGLEVGASKRFSVYVGPRDPQVPQYPAGGIYLAAAAIVLGRGAQAAIARADRVEAQLNALADDLDALKASFANHSHEGLAVVGPGGVPVNPPAAPRPAPGATGCDTVRGV